MALRVIFMGTPEFSAATLRALAQAGHDIAAVYSQPPRPAGRRGLELTKSPVHVAAEALGIAVRTPRSLKGEDEQQAFRALDADVAVVVAYGLLLPKPILEGTRLGAYNGHASLLPRWRGAAPIQRAIMAGDKQTGIVVMQMDEGLDTGAMGPTEIIAITPEMTAGELHDQMMRLGADLMGRALAALERAAASVRYHHRLTGLGYERDGVGSLSFGDGRVVLQPEDAVILALPPEQAAALLSLDLPLDHQPIVNGHFRFATDGLPGGEAFLGLVGGTAEWLFRRDGVISTTTSAAAPLSGQPAETIAALLWRDIVRALDLPAGTPLPPHRIVKEKRATLAQTPAMARARPGAATIWRNLALAGDWTDTGLPCTIEGAVRSGRLAVEAID